MCRTRTRPVSNAASLGIRNTPVACVNCEGLGCAAWKRRFGPSRGERSCSPADVSSDFLELLLWKVNSSPYTHQGNSSQRGSLYSHFLFCGENWRRRAGLRATWSGRRWSSPPLSPPPQDVWGWRVAPPPPHYNRELGSGGKDHNWSLKCMRAYSGGVLEPGRPCACPSLGVDCRRMFFLPLQLVRCCKVGALRCTAG